MPTDHWDPWQPQSEKKTNKTKKTVLKQIACLEQSCFFIFVKKQIPTWIWDTWANKSSNVTARGPWQI